MECRFLYGRMAVSASKDIPVEEKSFEDALNRLDEIVRSLDTGGVSLEESLKLFGEGAELLALCDKKLVDAKLKIEKLFPEGNA
jgi:exodeoxyribonuclease VII small subunit